MTSTPTSYKPVSEKVLSSDIEIGVSDDAVHVVEEERRDLPAALKVFAFLWFILATMIDAIVVFMWLLEIAFALRAFIISDDKNMRYVVGVVVLRAFNSSDDRRYVVAGIFVLFVVSRLLVGGLLVVSVIRIWKYCIHRKYGLALAYSTLPLWVLITYSQQLRGL